MEVLTADFIWSGQRGRIAWDDGRFLWLDAAGRLPPMPIAPGSAVLCQLPNAAIIRYRAGVPCWESPHPGCAEPPAGRKGDW